MKLNAHLSYQEEQQHEKHTFNQIPIFMQHTFITYGEHATYTHMQDSHHNKLLRNSLVSSLSKNRWKRLEYL